MLIRSRRSSSNGAPRFCGLVSTTGGTASSTGGWGNLRLEIEGRTSSVGSSTTVWWRRLGSVTTRDLADPDEAQLTREEQPALFLGALIAQHPRWVDHPGAVDLAEVKLHQLEVARGLGIGVPETVVTNDPSAAEVFSAEGLVVAKAASAGDAPVFVTDVPEDLLQLVQAAPVLLQRAVRGGADLRVVTVGREAFIWRRVRDPEGPPDWRQLDPDGVTFRRQVGGHAVGEAALKVADSLRLSHSVQDWLETPSGLLFLEVNPAGNWLFLEGAESSVLPSLAAHLLKR